MGTSITSVILPELLARKKTVYSVQIPLAQFKRASALLLDSEGDFKAECQFSAWESYTKVSGRWQAQLQLQCQRCLKPMDYPVDVAFQLICVETQEQANELPDELDPVILDEERQIHVVDLFEDDIILQLPSVARHEGDVECTAGKMEYGNLPNDIEQDKPKPFAALKDLKLKH
jgi:uncharacterized protein